MLVFLKVHLQIYRQQSKLSKMTLTYGSLQGLKGSTPFALSWEKTKSRFLGSLGLVLCFSYLVIALLDLCSAFLISGSRLDLLLLYLDHSFFSLNTKMHSSPACSIKNIIKGILNNRVI